MYHIIMSSVHITTCWNPNMLHMKALLQGRTFKTITWPVHNIVLCSNHGIGGHGGIFYHTVKQMKRG